MTSREELLRHADALEKIEIRLLHGDQHDRNDANDIGRALHALRSAAQQPSHASPGTVQSWAVTVSVNGDQILTIGHNHLSGIENIDDYKEAVENCARHLFSFIAGREYTDVAQAACRCICQEQHRRGYCTEPGCPYSVTSRTIHPLKTKDNLK
jgi:hypothetical protein